MQHLKAAPMGRMLYAWIAGIVFARQFSHLQHEWLFYVGNLFLMLALSVELASFRWRERLPFVGILAPFVLSFCFSASTYAWHDERRNPSHYIHLDPKQHEVLVELIESPQIRTNRIRLEVRCKGYFDSGRVKSLSGKLLVYLPKESINAKEFVPGQVYRMALRIDKIPTNKIPGGFDYADYAARQQLFGRAFVKEGKYKKVAEAKPGLLLWQYRCTAFLKQRLAQAVNTPAELGIAQALLFGERSDIDRDLWQAYSRSGIVHLVAISGMHLGMIYVGLLALFRWLPLQRKTALIPALLCMWAFAFITGLPASVLRAACMFSLLGIAEGFNQKHQPINTLYASAFLLLLFDPHLLFDIGFQLSYLAVAGLMLFQAPIYRFLMNYCPAYGHKPMELVAGTLAAQILTTPCILFWFHQIPILVLFTNLIAVPWSTLIIFAEIAWVALTPLPFDVGLVGKAITWAIQWLNRLALSVGDLSVAVWETAQWTLLEIGLLYAVLYYAFLYLKTRHTKRLLLSLSALCLVVFAGTVQTYQAHQQSGLILSTRKRELQLHLISGNHALLFPATVSEDQWTYTIKPALTYFHADTQTTTNVHVIHGDSLHVFSSRQLQVVLLQKPYTLRKPMAIDYLIVAHHVPLGKWLSSWSAKHIVCVPNKYESLPQVSTSQAIISLQANDAFVAFASP